MVPLIRWVVVTMLAIGVCVLAAPAAQAREPATGFEEFFGCPEQPVVIDHCLTSKITGRLELGRIVLDIDRPITQNGGVPPTFPAPFLFNERGGMFSPRFVVRRAGRVSRPSEFDRVHAIVQPAGTAVSSLPFGNVLPLRLKLEHPLLGPSCFVGSDSNAIRLDLTTATTAPPPPNQPISGALPGFGPDPVDPRISLVTDGLLVDNAFAAPAARGCGPAGHRGGLNGWVNELAGLPSPAGTNTAVLRFGARLATQADVYPPAD